jgi:hypothetical protein
MLCGCGYHDHSDQSAAATYGCICHRHREFLRGVSCDVEDQWWIVRDRLVLAEARFGDVVHLPVKPPSRVQLLVRGPVGEGGAAGAGEGDRCGVVAAVRGAVVAVVEEELVRATTAQAGRQAGMQAGMQAGRQTDSATNRTGERRTAACH